MSRLPLCLVTATLLALAACNRPPAGDAPPVAAEPPPGQAASPTRGSDFEISWQGVLPCADCDGIQTRLQLRSAGDDRRYLLEETYLGGEGEGENVFRQEGEWVERHTSIRGLPAVVYRLDPRGPGRWFWLQPDGSLEMLESEGRPANDGVLYRLQR